MAYVAGAFGGASGYATAAMAADDAPVMYNNQDFPENVYVPVFFRFVDQAHGSVGHVVIWDGGVTVTASDTKTNAVSSAAVNKAVAASVGGKTMKIKQINYVPGTAAPSQQTTKTYKQVIQPNLDAPAAAMGILKGSI
ncbi:hypothetical protein H7R52_06120 [Weissella confusa]|uniref:Uncharacterized protein n=1 Tax=Weissella confusa TaxID=1583 RepID=A0A923NFD9_WEICO|nr:hypothetical protein [Weissella confusa]